MFDAFDKKKELLLTEETIQGKYKLSECCNPIPGDPVMGYIDDDNSIVIHKLQCPVAARLKSSHGNRVLAASWKTNKVLMFPATIYIKGLDKVGLLNQITQVISQLFGVNIRRLEIETSDGLFEGRVQVYVHDVDEVVSIMDDLKKISDVKEVARL